jgi:hypothetical protein
MIRIIGNMALNGLNVNVEQVFHLPPPAWNTAGGAQGRICPGCRPASQAVGHGRGELKSSEGSLEEGGQMRKINRRFRRDYVRSEVFTAVTMKNVVFWV